MSGFLIGTDVVDMVSQVDSGDASTVAFTLDNASTTNGTNVYISGVRQVPTTDYSVSGTTITFSSAPPTGTSNILYTYTKPSVVNVPADASVTAAKVGAGAVTGPKLGGGVIPATTGFSATVFDLGTNASGTETLAESNGNFQKGVNGGAHTLAPQTNDSTIVVQYTNNASAGAVTTSGYSIVTGDTLTTTNADDFMLYSTVLNSFDHLHVVALQ